MSPPAVSVEQFSQLLCDLAFEAVSLLDANGLVTATSDKEASLVGGQPGQTPSPQTFAEVHSEDLTEAKRVWHQMIAAGGLPIRSCLRMKHRDGSWRMIEAVSRNLLDDPQLQQVVVNWRDVTAIRQTEQALVASQAHYRMIAENTRDLILKIAQSGRLTYLSPSSLAVLGRSAEELVDSDYYSLVHPEDLPAVRQCHEAVSQSQSPVAAHRFRRSDGSWTWIESTARRPPDGDGSEVLVVARQITPRQKIDEPFLQALKMDAIGRLAGGVAHDFNNLLSIIVSAGSLLHEELPVDHPSQPMTEEIRTACRRAADLTRQLLAFSRRQMLIPASVSVNDLIRATLEGLKGQLAEEINVVTRLDPQVGSVHVDPHQIERVLRDLTLNARDAMPDGGQLTFSTSNLSVSASNQAAAPDTAMGEYVAVNIEDSGVGMNALTRAHLFEPFFTTKPRGKGVGLGLATAYGVIRQSGGQIRVSSEIGQGTSFLLLFPRAEATKPVAPAPAATPKAIPTGTETILLVEDDHAVRRVAATLLSKKGYRVIQAEGGKEALALSDDELRSVHLLLTDLLIPGMSGTQIAATLRARRPELKVLFMSGCSTESVDNLLHKPFTLETLSRRVRDVLDHT